jgi:hypothetical protein
MIEWLNCQTVKLLIDAASRKPFFPDSWFLVPEFLGGVSYGLPLNTLKCFRIFQPECSNDALRGILLSLFL